MVLVAFGANFVWEMLQMRAYTEMRNRPWLETVPVCALAALGDAVMTIALYCLVAFAFRDRQRWLRGSWKTYTALSLLGSVSAFLIELLSIITGYWSYAKTMRMVPGLNVGLWPLLQLTILVPLAVWTAALWSRR